MSVSLEEKKYIQVLDRSLQVIIGRMTGGISPAALLLAFTDWLAHLAVHPGKQFELAELTVQSYWHLVEQMYKEALDEQPCDFCILTKPNDTRFTGKAWQQYPYRFFYESFLLQQNWWHVSTMNVNGVSDHHAAVTDFMLRQVLDMLSPSNFLLTNPEIQQVTQEKLGVNLLNGYENLLDDIRRYQFNKPPAGAEHFVIGDNVAVSPGKVIYRNRLIELIQYSPTTETVYAEPILITPAWIMKYYILDLSPKHSLVRYLVKNGHTVFMISWKNPKQKDRHLSMLDYQRLGVMSALDAVTAIIPQRRIHLVGYCLGGTLAAITAATMARDNDQRLASLTLFAAQTDFTEPGELGLFIDTSQISFLESLMEETGYLDTHQMTGAFQLLRSNDLIWSRMIHNYLIGERKPLTDLMAWNADSTRLPYKMHSEYLRHLFLQNELAEGEYIVDGKPIALSDINIPLFVVATERDHVSPWKSVFKINLLISGDVTFALTSGGHNVGIVSLPSKKTKRRYRLTTLKSDDRYVDAQTWYDNTKITRGSWWPAFEKWIAAHSDAKIAPPSMGCITAGYIPIADAPGTYVLGK